MNWKHYTIGLSLLLSSAAIAWACVDEDSDRNFSSAFDYLDDHSASDMPDLTDNNKETVDFWYRYTDKVVPERVIKKFLDTPRSKWSSSALITYFRQTDDKEAIDLLTTSARLNETIRNYLEDDFWSYSENIRSAVEPIYRSITIPAGGKLRDRWVFLKMRALYVGQQYPSVLALWQSDGSKIADSALRQRAEGYLAGVYYKDGKYVEALEIYARQGDYNSISWCMEQLAGLRSLQDLAEKYPHSKAVDYVLQDYVNYLATSTCEPCTWCDTPTVYCTSQLGEYRKYELPDQNVHKAREEFIALANKVLADGKVLHTQPWALAKALVLEVDGQHQAATTALAVAASMDADNEMLANYKRVKTYIDLHATGTPEGDASFSEEFETLAELAKVEKANIQKVLMSDNPTQDNAKTPYAKNHNFMHDILLPEMYEYFKKSGRMKLAYTTFGINDDWGSPTIMKLSSDGSVDDLKELQKMQTAPDGPLEACLVKMHPFDNRMLDDMIGTRLVRECKFDEALTYLDKVPVAWSREQNYYPYLVGRSISVTHPFVRRKKMPSEAKSPRNLKADMVRNVITLKNSYNNATGNAKARAAFEYANALFSISNRGDLWAVSDFSWSYYSTPDALAHKAYEIMAANLSNATTNTTRGNLFYGILSIPEGDEDMWEYSYDYDSDKTERRIKSLSSLQREGLQYLRDHRYELADYVSSCDIYSVY